MSEWDEKYRDLENQKRKSNTLNYIGGIISIVGIIAFFYFLNGFDVSTRPVEIRWEALIITLILLPPGLYILKRGKAKKLKTTEQNFLIFWKAYKMLEKFREREEEEDMNNAKDSIKEIKNLFSVWFTERAPKSISSLTNPIVDNLNEKVVPLIEEKNYQEISSIATGFMNVALQLYNKEIDQDFLNQFEKRLEGFHKPKTKEKPAIKKESLLQRYPLLKISWVAIVTGTILYFVLTYLEMESGPAFAGAFVGGIALTALVAQGMKKK